MKVLTFVVGVVFVEVSFSEDGLVGSVTGVDSPGVVEAGWLVKRVDDEVDSLVETVNEDKVCRVVERFNEEVGLIVKMLDNGDVDLVVEANHEDEVCSAAEMFDEEVGWLVEEVGWLVNDGKGDIDLFVNAGDEGEVCR